MLTGAVHGVVGFYDHTIDLQAKGKFVQAVVQFSQAPGEAEIVSSRQADSIRSPADFKGHTLGVTGLGSSTHLLTQYLVATHGVKPADVRFMAVGSGAGFVAAMRQGVIDAGMTTEPTVSRLLHSGDARLLVDLRTPQTTEKVLGGVYPGRMPVCHDAVGQLAPLGGSAARQRARQGTALHRQPHRSGDRNTTAGRFPPRRLGAVRCRPARQQVHVHQGRRHARVRADHRPEGDEGRQPFGAGQTHRPPQDLHHRVHLGSAMTTAGQSQFGGA